MDYKRKKKLLTEKLLQMWNVQNLDVPLSKNPLFNWIVPQLNSKERLNWAIWDKNVLLQEEKLKCILENGLSFFLWKKTSSKLLDSSEVHIISKKEATTCFLFDLIISSYNPLLCDFEDNEKNVCLLKGENDARKKIDESDACYCIKEDGEFKGIAIISSIEKLKYSFINPERGMEVVNNGMKEQECKGIIYLDVILTIESGKSYGSKILQKIENDYPDHILVLFSIPNRRALYFYSHNGFSYSSIEKNSINLLPFVLDKIDIAIEAWHDGYPLLTRLHAETEKRVPHISLFSPVTDWKKRDNVDVFFDENSLSFIYFEEYEIKNYVKKHVLDKKKENKIIIITPTNRISKKKYYKITKSILKASQELLDENKDIIEITVACDNNNDRQVIIKKTAMYLWNEYKLNHKMSY